jgi:phage FluMu gp28-like protein
MIVRRSQESAPTKKPRYRVTSPAPDDLAELLKHAKPQEIDLDKELEVSGVDISQNTMDYFPDGHLSKKAVFLPYQREWFKEEATYAIAEKSRRTGLTWAQAAKDVMTAARPRRRGGKNCFYVGSKKEMALEFIAACALFAKAFDQLADADVYEMTFWDEGKKDQILAYMIRFPKSTFKIQALSSRPSNLRGLQGNVTIDEAAFHMDLDELFKAAQALTMWKAKVRLISTHNGVDNPFNQYIQDALAGRKDYAIHRITLDDAIAQGLYRRICYVTGETWSKEEEQKWRDELYKNAPTKEMAEEEYGCVPRQSGGTYLTRPVRERAMVKGRPVIRYEAPENFEMWTEAQRIGEMTEFCEKRLLPELEKLPADRPHIFGEDFARKGDLTVLAPGTITPAMDIDVPFLVELRNVPYECQKQVVFFLIHRLPRFRAAAFDETGNGGYLAEVTALHFDTNIVERVSLNQSWYRE